MTKDLALLVGPDQAWLTTEEFLGALDENLQKALRLTGGSSRRTTECRLSRPRRSTPPSPGRSERAPTPAPRGRRGPRST